MSLREELLGLSSGTPRFRILLPAEWASWPVTPELGAQLEQRTRPAFARAGRPDLDGMFTSQLNSAMKGLAEAGAKYVFLPSERTPGKDPLALSMIATFIDSPDGPLDAWVTSRIRDGAELLDTEGRIVYWRDRRAGLDDETHRAQSIYVISVPGTNRRKALMLTGSTIVGAETADDDEYAVAVRMIFDAMASTVTWVADDVDTDE
ncbi:MULTISPECIES: hypothetical protein [Microbacterium]|uniref:hypothetical protein n=1 Tax=Microbacterium TaxID=33882 RepID=UPI0006F20FFA|nr:MULTISPECIES: hypothetical protein [Microbacterium]AZS45918.1 hypothetical protein CVS53_00579 [Microbacterium oxydans]KQV00268.1 hypothetical protein ASC55_13830 [Microbacterium sp. Root322]KQY74280.1 hypothetical protein ASD13_12435 [Microbacterium sp. Root1433D1]WKT91031.1 hypothetical protein QYR02_08890 [Microbacterium liquefaciens]